MTVLSEAALIFLDGKHTPKFDILDDDNVILYMYAMVV